MASNARTRFPRLAADPCRWSVETTIQDCHSGIGLDTTRGRYRRTVTRAAPCLFGMDTAVTVLFHSLPQAKRAGSVR